MDKGTGECPSGRGTLLSLGGSCRGSEHPPTHMAQHIYHPVKCGWGQRATAAAPLLPYKSSCCLDRNPIFSPKTPVSFLLAPCVGSW